MLRKFVIVGSFIFTLAACGGGNYTNLNVTQRQADRDLEECRYEGLIHSPRNALIANEIRHRCMKLRGYSN